MTTSQTEWLLLATWLVLIPVVFVIYAVPSIVAFRRRHPNRYVILAINLAFGGTGVGWLAGLVWACGAVHLSNEGSGSHGGESGLNLFANDPKLVRLAGPGAVLTAIGSPGLSDQPPLSVAAAAAALERLSTLRAAADLSEAEFAELKAGVLRSVREGGNPQHA